METRDPKSLRAHPLSATIYRDGVSDDLRESIKAKGIYEPLLITWDNTVVSGHRRLACALELKLKTVPVMDTGLRDPVDIEEAVIEANRYREKTTEQKAREYEVLLRIETERAKIRQAATQPKPGENVVTKHGKQEKDGFGNVIGDAKQVVVNLPPPNGAKSRDVAATKVGMAERTAKTAAEVVHAIDELEKKGKTEDAEHLRTTLNNKSVSRAHREARTTGAIKPKQDAPKQKTTHAKQNFNLTNDKIEWARWSWNPVTGCEHGCPYCYARDIAEPPSSAFPHGFKPTLREERLTAPADMGAPDDHLQQIAKAMAPKGTVVEDITALVSEAKRTDGYKTVFAVSMGDLFGEWVPQEWIDRVFDAVRQGPTWNFLFLTKNPERMAGLDFPKNAWAGTTVDCQDRVERAQDAFANVTATVRFVSCEPLTGELIFSDMTMFDWLIIGGRSKSDQLPAAQPDLFHAASLMVQAASFGVAVYCKPNLTVVKQYPLTAVGR